MVTDFSRREFLRLLGGGILATALPAALSAATTRSRRPNFVVILADDCSASELACYGHRLHQTPHLDLLAARGLRFKTCWATPVSSPSRALLMTGQYGFRTGVLSNSMDPKTPLVRDHPVFPKLLKAAGYVTALAGKWQLRGNPTEFGFDEWCIWGNKYDLPEGLKPDSGYERPEHPARYWHPCVYKNGSLVSTKPQDYGPDMYTQFLIDFMARHREEPMLVYYPMCLTHHPFLPTPDSVRGGQPSLQSDKEKNFRANVEYMDKLVGRLVKALDELGLRDNTFVFFTTDNGTEGSGKHEITDRGCRVPMIVNCPGSVPSLGAVDQLTDFSDVLPTLLDLAAIPRPRNSVLDGTSFAPLLRGERFKGREWIFSYYESSRMLRTNRWLLQGDGRFYDCSEGETAESFRDVSDSSDPEVVQARRNVEGILKGLPAPSKWRFW